MRSALDLDKSATHRGYVSGLEATSLKTDCERTGTHQITADILPPSPNGHAANMVPIGQEGHESELIRHEQSNEENTTAGKLDEEHKELVFK
jgi:hypothetical protein